MKTYREALSTIRELAKLRRSGLKSESCALENIVGRTCAEDVLVSEAHPLFDNSAMDGFAIRTEWSSPASESNPLEFEIKGVIAAGAEVNAHNLEPASYEIMTGAKMPLGFDSVIRVEDAEIVKKNDKRFLRIKKPLKMWDQVRRRGEDYSLGNLLLKQGQQLKPSHVMALASQGIASIKVWAPIRIGLISTGSEIVPYYEKPLAGQVLNSTHPFLSSKMQSPNLHFEYLGSVADSFNELRDLVSGAISNFDVLITTGAVSVGLFDIVHPVITDLGARVHFHKVAMRPGKPLLFAEFEKGPLLMGFPGNPISSAVAFRFFLEPLLSSLLGSKMEQSYKLPLSEDVTKVESLCCFWKAKIEESPHSVSKVRALKGQESFRIAPLVDADHWAILPEGKALFKAGEIVEVFPQDSEFYG